MKKSSNYKALYKFTKKQKMKESTSTKDLDDSLDRIQRDQDDRKFVPFMPKNSHQRTQSCPSISDPMKLVSPRKFGNEEPDKQTQKTIRSYVTGRQKKTKLTHQYSGSLVSHENSSITGQSISIDHLSSALYRKNNNEKPLKKTGAHVLTLVKKNFMIKNEPYTKTKIEQQIKAYQLTEQLKNVEKKSTGITIKQQILEDLLKKYQYDVTISEN